MIADPVAMRLPKPRLNRFVRSVKVAVSTDFHEGKDQRMLQFEVIVPDGASVDRTHALMPIRGTGGTTAAYAEVSEDVMGPAVAGSEVVRESGPRLVARS